MSKLAMGIDLGTTYSCAAIWRDGKIEIITNEQGNRTTPSYVSFNQNEHLVGEAAKNQASSNPQYTIFDAKRLIGRKFSDDNVQTDIKLWPFKVTDIENKPYFEIKYNNQDHYFSPEQISAMILTKMKQIVSNFMGEEITNAVITVPAYFNDSQRQATKDAGRIAGLNVIRIINEPTAAALAYGLDKKSGSEINILIFDCGGGTHDVTLLTLTNGVFKVRATCGDSHLGGEDFDNRLVNWCVEDFKKKYNLDLNISSKSLRRLRTSCEKAKRTLSSTLQTDIEVDSLLNGIDYRVTITRFKFENLCRDLFLKTIDPIEKVLADAHIDRTKINEIVLVGGSTRIPKIKQMLSDFFGGKKLNESVNPDEAVAYGAAIQAAILSGQSEAKLSELVLIDVTPLSLGLETVGGLMTNIVDRNSTIPCKKSRTFSTHSDNQTEVVIQIYEGERQFTKDNNCLGTFTLSGIIPAPRGVPKIEVTFSIDTNGILNVNAVDETSNKSQNITIVNRNKFTEEQINKMIQEAKEFEAADREKKLAIDAKNKLENYIHSIKQSINNQNNEKLISQDDREKVRTMCSELMIFVETHPQENKNIYDDKYHQLEQLWNPIAIKIYGHPNIHT